MTSSVYLFSLRPQAGMAVELRVTARSVAVAQREVQRFLAEHDGSGWPVEGVSREPLHPAHPAIVTTFRSQSEFRV